MSVKLVENEENIVQLNEDCSLSLNPPDQNIKSCIQCHKKCHTTCANDITYKCPKCTSIHPSSPARSCASGSSTQSRISQTRKIQLKLQRLEEERTLNNEYLNQKYQLLEEVEDLSDASSNKSQSIRSWLNQIPDQVESAKVNTGTNQPLQTVTTNNATKQVSHLPNNTVYYNVPSQLTNFENNNSTNIYTSNPTIQSCTTFLPPNVTNTHRDSSLAPNCISDSAGLQQHMMHQTKHFLPEATVCPLTSTHVNSQMNFQRPIPNYATGGIFSNANQNPFILNPNFSQNEFNQGAPITSAMHIPPPAAPTAAPTAASQPRNVAFFHGLQQHHVNARQSVPKELPLFSGNPEEWPSFISTYRWSTDACAFSNTENLIRLQKSLKGEALQSVHQMLVHPANVPGVLQVLSALYGQPEKIINSIKNRIKISTKVHEHDLKTLTTFAINVHSLVSTITASNLNDELNNSTLVQELLQKLPSSYQMQWAIQKINLSKQNKRANLLEFDMWLFNIGLTASSITIDDCPSTSNRYKTIKNSTDKQPYKKDFVHTHNDQLKCIVCSNNKNICKTVANCKKFLSLNRGDKWSEVRKHKLCRFCLNKHRTDCNQKKKCGIDNCEYFHHPSLHRYPNDTNETNDKISSVNVNNNHMEDGINNSHSAKLSEVLFKVIPIKIYGENKSVNTFAFIDEGSSVSLMDESLLKQLELKGVSNPLCLRWTGGMERTEKSSQKLTIQISGGNQKRMYMNVCTVKSLNLPTQSLNYKEISERYPHLRNLPVESYKEAVPKILIGLNNFDLGICSKIREGSSHQPVAIRTKLGWLVYGIVAEPNSTTRNMSSKNLNFHLCDCSARDEKLDELVKSFYALDSLGINIKDPLIAEQDQRCLDLFNKFIKQKVDGHYEVPLLWKYNSVDLPPSYEMALKRLICLERKLRQDSDLFIIFEKTIANYLSKGYIRKLNSNEVKLFNGKVWYLPIFAVFNKNKPHKSRVVWDAAAKANGVSLNSFLLKGPELLASLPSILFKFRQKSVAICGDIEEMFHQIFIRSEDRDVQRFLWRNCNQNTEPDVYIMDVMIFGATCAPSISQYVKNLNATKFENQFPRAVKSITKNHYVDDLLDSVDTRNEAVKLISDVSYIHRQGGFNIRNWICNDKIVMDSLQSTVSREEKCLNSKEVGQIEKVLGVFWEHREDFITFKISKWLTGSDFYRQNKTPTKRQMLRLVMSIYDPLGLIGHIIMYVKVLMQEVWRQKIDWDEKIPPELEAKWTQWVSILPDVQKIKIRRCYLNHFENYTNVDVQLHTFVDASKDGYAAVCYFRLKKEGNIVCSLVGSKTRVAPMKLTSIPRLELMAALIGARFAKFIAENHDIKILKKFYWSDSKTVLSWINSDHRKYNQFVAFRITEILELSSLCDWSWVPSKQNVADDATKWTKIPVISDSSRWLNGPDFLYLSEEEWPKTPTLSKTIDEERIHHSFNTTKVEPNFDVYRFSKWKRLLRATGYVLRFVNNCKKKNTFGELTQEELREAELILYKQAQYEEYNAEISSLQSNLPISKSSDIYRKSPYLENGILRVYGRIDNADVPRDQKRPIILPRKSYITRLILMHFHEKFYHANNETVVNEIRQIYSISKLRATIKSVISYCQMCKIRKVIPQNPQMAKLPRARLASFVAPFAYTGMDYFGPILVSVNRHKEKRYGCLFTCLTIRAVHIEITHSLTTSSCILAIRNFVARRGTPVTFYSDNGTNFVGAERELRETLTEVDQNEIIKAFTTSTTNWTFNPPASPHMGGAWERLIRSIKTTLYKIMPSRSPSDELLLSMLLEVENIINSRPLAYVPVDDETAEALTPNHFLLGSSNGLKPMSVCNDSGVLLKQSWLISQQYANIFWKKWVSEYLPTLTCRSKWYERKKPLCQGDLVIVVDSSLPRNVWIRGKVLDTKLAKDGQVRSARILTKTGILERPVAKLAILEVAPPEKSDVDESPCHTGRGMLTPLPKSQD